MKLNLDITEALWRNSTHTVEELEAAQALIACAGRLKYFPSPRAGFQLLRLSKGVTRYFIMQHELSQQCILFPPYDVPGNAHNCTAHFKYLEDCLKPIEEEAPLSARFPMVEDKAEKSAKQAVPEQSLSQAAPIDTLLTEAAALKLERPKANNFALAWVWLYQLSLIKDNAQADAIASCAQHCRDYIATYIKGRDMDFYCRKQGRNVHFVFRHKGRHSSIELPPLNTHDFLTMIGDELRTLVDKENIELNACLRVLIFSFSLDPEACVDLLRTRELPIDRMSFNLLLKEATTATKNARADHLTFFHLLALLQAKKLMPLIDRDNIQNLLQIICHFFVAKACRKEQNLEPDLLQNCLSVIHSIIRYFDSNQLSTLFNAGDWFFSTAHILEILPLITDLFTESKVNVILRWLDKRNSPQEKEDILHALLPAFSQLTALEQSELGKNYQKLFASHPRYSSCVPVETSAFESISISTAVASRSTPRRYSKKSKKSAPSLAGLLKKINSHQSELGATQVDSLMSLATNFLDHLSRLSTVELTQLPNLSSIIDALIQRKFSVIFSDRRFGNLTIFELLAYFGKNAQLHSISRFVDSTELRNQSYYALFWAATNLQVSTTRILLSVFNYDPNAVNELRETMLWHLIVKNTGAKKNILAMINLLIDEGAQVDAVTFQGFTLLMGAIIADKVDYVTLLLARGANPNTVVTLPDNSRMTALDIAWTKVDTTIKRLLERQGAVCCAGPTFAAIGHDIDQSTTALNITRNVILQKMTDFIQKKCHDQRLFPPLSTWANEYQEAVSSFNVTAVIQFFRDHPLLINSTILAIPPMGLAIRVNLPELMKFLLTETQINLHQLSTKFYKNQTQANVYTTALHAAIEHEIFKFTEDLCKAGAPLDIPDSNDNYPIHIAITKTEDPTHLELLLSFGADPKQRQAGGKKLSAFELGIWHHKLTQLCLLARYGALENLSRTDIARIKELTTKRNDQQVTMLVNYMLETGEVPALEKVQLNETSLRYYIKFTPQ